MFYSVPHKGSALADVTLPLLRRSIELVEIQRSKLHDKSILFQVLYCKNSILFNLLTTKIPLLGRVLLVT